MQPNEEIILQRDCPGVLIPSGEKINLHAGQTVFITQALGGTYTVYINGNLARVEATDADALGKQPPAPADTNAGPLTEKTVFDVLRTCYDPEIPVNIVDLGLVYDLQISPLPDGVHRVDVKMTLTAPGCGMGPVIQQDVADKLLALPGVVQAEVHLVWDPPWNRDMLSEAAKLELGLM